MMEWNFFVSCAFSCVKYLPFLFSTCNVLEKTSFMETTQLIASVFNVWNFTAGERSNFLNWENHARAYSSWQHNMIKLLSLLASL